MSFELMDTTAFCLRAKDSADALCNEENQQVQLSRVTSSSLYIQSRKMMYQSRATMDPVANFSAIAYPVDMVSRRKKSRSSKALQPGAKYSVVKVTSRGSSRHEPAAKQLTIYEELSKLDVNC
ncbi:hypothetical protein F511_46170 [Dorcoceras hygrometricum]|uniref:Uncharacterized protein n=1 Tax=Dorcoceras hygrometricum TaxID=472368 RepID=A0A2Z6ZU96_9LAMI|nr:hypothetical protein F511_46170 [Dorcoceras hygrometricum]